MKLFESQMVLDKLCENCDHPKAVCAHYPCDQYVAIEQLPPAQTEPEELDFIQPHKKISVQLEVGQGVYDETEKIIDDYLNCDNTRCIECKASEHFMGDMSYCRVLYACLTEKVIDKIKGVLDEI